MKITDGRRTITITMQTWTGAGYSPDFAEDFFDAGALEIDNGTGAYIVPDVEYCIDQANDYKLGRGDFSDCEPDENLCVSVIRE